MAENSVDIDIKPRSTKFSRFLTELKTGIAGRRSEPFVEEPLPPFDFRYAMEYANGELGVQNIESLINNNFSDIANYLIVRGLNGDPHRQCEYLEKYVDSLLSDVPAAAVKKTEIEGCQQLREIGRGPLQSKKLAKVMAQGVNLWEQRFTDIAQEVKRMSDHPTPVYIGYAGLLGLRQGVEAFSDDTRPLLVLIPEQIKNESQDKAGYLITLSDHEGERVQTLPKDFIRPESAIFIDDTKSTGKHLNETWKFWSGQQLPMPDDRVKVVFET